MALSSCNPEAEISGRVTGSLSHWKWEIAFQSLVIPDPRPLETPICFREITGLAVPTIHRPKEAKTLSTELSTITERKKKRASPKSTSSERLPGSLSKPAEILSGWLSGVKHAGLDGMKRKMTFHKPAIFTGWWHVTRPDSASSPTATSSNPYVHLWMRCAG